MLDHEVKSRITGVRYQIETFDFYFVGDCQSIASLTIKTMQKLRSDDSFDLFWTNVNSKADKLEIGPPGLPRKRRRPARFFLEMLSQNFLQTSNLITDKSILKLLTL